MPSDADRAKDIFLGATARPDRAERAAFVAAACGPNADLKRWVEELLATFDRAAAAQPAPADGNATTDFPSGDAPPPAGAMATTGDASEPDANRTTDYQSGEAPPRDPTATTDYPAGPGPADATTDHVPGGDDDSPAPAARPRRKADSEIGTVIADKYTLVGVIGEGGMGSVYLANQSEPVKREVAVKLIKAGFDSRNVLARFEAERQALALMEHPNIARVYDGGTTDDGWPFFAMELVRGKPITKYCDEKRLPPAARLDLFVQVCRGVQHAHQKGIIHRDLKPGNILVMEVDGKPTPKIIDFGVAKATEQRLTDLSFSDVGAVVGTPVYMSPEQAEPTTMDIDTRTDVYALGVVLYELLTGTPPLRSKDFQRAALLEMLRMVREVEPPRPSTRLSADAALPNIAASRALEPGQLLSLLRGDIDWIVMKSIEKNREQRYESANGFAADILRYLANEPVVARAPTRGYRLRKFVRRNRAAVAVAAAFAALLTVGVIGVVVQWREAVYQRGQADEARGKAETNYGIAMDQRKVSFEALGQMIDIARKDLPQAAPGAQALQRKVLTVAGGVLAKVIGNADADVTMNDNALAIVYLASAELHEAVGDVKSAVAEAQRAVDLLDGALRAAAGKPDEYQTGTRQNLAAIETFLARLLIQIDPAKARPHFDRARELFGDLGPNAPADYRHNQAQLYRLMGTVTSTTDPAGSRKLYDDSLRVSEELYRDHPTEKFALALVDSYLLVGAAARRQRAAAAAEGYFRRAIQIAEGELAKAPKKVEWMYRAGLAHDRLGTLLLRTGNGPGAVAEFQAAAAHYRSLTEPDPNNILKAAMLADILYSLGLAELRTGDNAAAAGHFQASLKIREARIPRNPAPAAYSDLMTTLARAGRPAEAAKTADFALKQFGAGPDLLVDTACCFAICSAVQPAADAAGKATAEGYAVRAVQDLARAIDLGYRDVVNLETEPDLDALRPRADFKKLLADLADKTK